MSTSLKTIDILQPGDPMIPVQASSDPEMIALWLNGCRSPATRRGYEDDLRRFQTFMSKPIRGITLPDLQTYDAALSASRLAPPTRARRLAVVKSLLKLAKKVGYTPFDVGALVSLPRLEDTLAARIMSQPDVWGLLRAERNKRNSALLRFLYCTGARISEASGLRWRQLTPRDFGGQASIFGKGGKTRPVLIPAGLWADMGALRGQAGPDDAVFRSREGGGPDDPTGGALNPCQIHRIVKKAAKRAGLSPAISAHWLRHGHVSHALDAGVAVHVVRATVGHASLETTTKYANAKPGDSSSLHLGVS
jgi:site-specific recombinase XerD